MKKVDNNVIKKILSVARKWTAGNANELERRVPSGGKKGQALMAADDGSGEWGDVVDRSSDQVIKGQKIFGASTDGYPVAVARRNNLKEALLVGLTDKILELRYVNDESYSTLRIVLENTDTEDSDGSNASERVFELESTQNTVTARLGGMYVAKKGFRKEGGKSSQFLKADGSVDSNEYATTQEASTAAKGLMSNTDKEFIEELKTSGFMPAGGEKGQILVSDGEKGVWTNADILDLLTYGVEWDPNVADPVLTRIGNMTYHKTLPIQSAIKGCIYNSLTKQVVYWLDEDDWTYKKGGNPYKGEPEQLARLDGYDGEVMVYFPEFWIKSWDESDRRRVRISQIEIDNTWAHQPAVFISAYRTTLLNTVPEDMGYLSSLEVNTAVSVVNSATYCRGGNNSSADDTSEDIFKRNLGKCRTNIKRGDFRIYARKGGKEIMSYREYKNILYWLYVIEYANFNSQAPFNPDLTSEGFRQGGLGDGITNVNLNVSTNWKNYNNACPLCPNGYTNEFGNGTGTKLITPELPSPARGDSFATRWRGIENPFGDVWTAVDGVIVNGITVVKDGVKYNEVYTTDDPQLYSDSDFQSMEKVGEEIVSEGMIKEWDLGSTAEIIPRLVGNLGNEQYKCDRHLIYDHEGLRLLHFGYSAVGGYQSGLGAFATNYDITTASSSMGYRTSCAAQ